MLIAWAGRVPDQRTTLYQAVQPEQKARSYPARPLLN
jgi:hypothetical protein